MKYFTPRENLKSFCKTCRKYELSCLYKFPHKLMQTYCRPTVKVKVHTSPLTLPCIRALGELRKFCNDSERLVASCRFMYKV